MPQSLSCGTRGLISLKIPSADSVHGESCYIHSISNAGIYSGLGSTLQSENSCLATKIKFKKKCWIVDGTNALNPDLLKLTFSMLHLFSSSEFIQDKACWQILAVFLMLQRGQPDPLWCQVHAQLSRGLGEGRGGRGHLWTEPAWYHLSFWLQSCAFSWTLHLSCPAFVESSPWAANMPLLADCEGSSHSPKTAYRSVTFNRSTRVSVHCLLNCRPASQDSLSAVTQPWFEMSNRAQKAIPCPFDPGFFGKYICSEENFRVAEKRVWSGKKQLKQ